MVSSKHFRCTNLLLLRICELVEIIYGEVLPNVALQEERGTGIKRKLEKRQNIAAEKFGIAVTSPGGVRRSEGKKK